mmetsp:Transcript_18633/g.43363  ORF Transcript_18633/g.43363 Transcript_18633/m.43363 type:complete len:148 (+) Transcript_18633:25-468(+)
MGAKMCCEPAQSGVGMVDVSSSTVAIVSQEKVYQSDDSFDEPSGHSDGLTDDTSTYIVDLPTNSQSLGFGIGHTQGENHLEIVKVHDIGAVRDWNAAHPDRQLIVGCKILSMNGLEIRSKDRNEMLGQISEALDSPTLRMEVLPRAS